MVNFMLCVCVHVCAQLLSHGIEFLQPHRLQPTRLLCPWDFPGKNTGMNCHLFLQKNTYEGKSYVSVFYHN